jgi:hypothetical protein
VCRATFSLRCHVGFASVLKEYERDRWHELRAFPLALFVCSSIAG